MRRRGGGGEKCQSRETDETEGWLTEKLRKKVGGEDRASEGRNEEREMKRRIRGGQHFDLDHGALVFTFNTAEGISTSHSPSSVIQPFQFSITTSLFNPHVSVLTGHTTVCLFLICYL